MTFVRIIYLFLTAIVCLVLLAGGYMHLTQRTPIMQTMDALGYPHYLSSIIGTAEIAAGFVLLLPRFLPGLKEFAYAGVTLLMMGAFASHLIMKQGPFAPSILVLAAVVLSYLLRKWKQS